MQTGDVPESVAEIQSADVARDIHEPESQPQWTPPKYLLGKSRVVVLVTEKVDRAVEIEAVKRNVTKRRFIEEALCAAVGIEPPQYTEKSGPKPRKRRRAKQKTEPAIPPAA